ncbi:MAG: stage II sporulation protein M [Candidatus Hydrothermarchaeales archaeon]
MIKKSFKIYLFGFTIGVIICFILLLSFPALYYAFLALLIKKAEVQKEVLGGNPALSISLNNVFAAFMCAYGGYLTSRVFLHFDSSAHSTVARILRLLDAKIARLPIERVKHYLALYTFPIFILFFNGFVLGAFFILYSENLEAYFANLLPHAFFEIPGILLAGSIGLSIAERAVFSEGEFRKKLDTEARKELLYYALVVGLLIIGALLEA